MPNVDNLNLTSLKAKLAAKWIWFIFFGAILLLIGIIASIALPMATTAVTVYIGIMMLAGGLIHMAHAFGVQEWGRFFFWLIGGLLYTIGGIICLIQPIMAATIFTFLLGFMLIIAGTTRILVGFQNHGISGWGWIVAAGIITTLAGLIITTGWPANSLWILGLFLAIDLIIQGWSLIAVGLGLRLLR